jgi:hypothetical protein
VVQAKNRVNSRTDREMVLKDIRQKIGGEETVKINSE